ncbi:hypothetical protein [Flavihumibacter profundi]|uniref:hypothetical protein n=1 Tax=Flavihumibacter profundi TaxID=2716883 RepID=UPI001CC546C3|nr:hypothetical protein [Flavihumibacter profundi]MBZ5859498.1 hypothetical protein [Flavihumibacter profundi]
MSGVKIQLSREEQEMAADTGIILTKNRILSAVMQQFGTLSEAEVAYTTKMRHQLPESIYMYPPKISRGENYQQLPWVMLDYPRVFAPEATLAIRHLFWWGNFFSCSLQVSGDFSQVLLGKMALWPEGTHVCVHASPWEHHFGPDNYLPVIGMDPQKIISLATQGNFLKLSIVLPVSQWDSAQGFLFNGFSSWMKLLL